MFPTINLQDKEMSSGDVVAFHKYLTHRPDRMFADFEKFKEALSFLVHGAEVYELPPKALSFNGHDRIHLISFDGSNNAMYQALDKAPEYVTTIIASSRSPSEKLFDGKDVKIIGKLVVTIAIALPNTQYAPSALFGFGFTEKSLRKIVRMFSTLDQAVRRD